MNNFKYLTSKQHLQSQAHMYVGKTDEQNITIISQKKIEKFKIINSVKKIFEEILENIIDNEIKESFGFFKVSANNNKFTFLNKISIPNMIGKISGLQNNVNIPLTLITKLRTSSKFSVLSNSIGTNGVGLKAINQLCNNITTVVRIRDEVLIVYSEEKHKMMTVEEYKSIYKTNTFPDYDFWLTIISLKKEDTKDEYNNEKLLLSKLEEINNYFKFLNKDIVIYYNNIENKIPTYDILNNFFPNGNQELIVSASYKYLYEGKTKVIDNINLKAFAAVEMNNKHNITIINGKYLYNQFKPIIKYIKTKEYNDKINTELFKHLKLIVIIQGDKIVYSSQSKDNTAGTFEISSIKNIKKLNLKDINLTKKTKNKKIFGTNFIETPLIKDTKLILVEGLSALTSVRRAIDTEFKKDKNNYSYYAITGKITNFIKNPKSIDSNKNTLDDITSILSRKKYKEIILFADADDDGVHIITLIISLFIIKFPEYLKLMKLTILPKYICCSEYFLNEEELSLHQKKNVKHNTIFCKGLGTYTNNDMCYILKNLSKYLLSINSNEENITYFKNIMGKETIFRKQVHVSEKTDEDLTNNNNININKEEDKELCLEEIVEIGNISLKAYVTIFLNDFIKSSTRRCLPAIEDSFNPSIRKIVYKLRSQKNLKEKVNQLSSKIIADLKYQHGDTSLSETIIRISNDYPTGLTLPIGRIIGSGGSRTEKGKDSAAARYISVTYNPIFKYIIREEDDIILKYRIEEGVKVEPETYFPIIPLILINYCEYIGNGYNTRLPTFTIESTILYIINYLKKKDNTNTLKLYVKGFTGDLTISKNNNTKKLYLESKGKYKKTGDNIEVVEIPHFISISQFSNILTKSGITHKMGNKATIDNPHFILPQLDDDKIEKLENMLFMRKSLELNIYKNDLIHIYDRYENILDDFIEIRLNAYKIRKDLTIKKYKSTILFYNLKICIYQMILEKYPKTEDDQKNIIEDVVNKEPLYKNHYNDCLNIINTAKITDVTKNKINILLETKQKLEKTLEKYELKSINSIWLDELKELFNFMKN